VPFGRNATNAFDLGVRRAAEWELPFVDGKLR
jgi:hypothetical protein